MAEQPVIHDYPDVLRYITDEQPMPVGTVEVSMALRPRIVRAGRPFEAIILLQNMSESPTEVHVRLQLPEKDAQDKKGRFLTKTENLVIDLTPAEVGYVKLPMTTLPDTAIANDYVIGADISVGKPSDKPMRIRSGYDENILDPSTLCPDKQAALEELKKLKFSAEGKRKRGGVSLRTHFSVLSGKTGTPLKLEPGWQSLWMLEDQNDEDLLLNKFRDLIRDKTLPRLRRQVLYDPLLAATTKRFENAGYPLMKIEADAIARLLTLMLEYAMATRTNQSPVDAGRYNIEPRLKEKRLLVDEEQPLPRWLVTFLRAVARDERVATVPDRAIPVIAYDDLLYDAMEHSFTQIERATGESLGTPEEVDAYIQVVLSKLDTTDEMDISYAYMPLVMGGIIAFDKILLRDERLSDVLGQFNFLLDSRKQERTADNSMIFDMTQRIMEQQLRQYGALDNRH